MEIRPAPNRWASARKLECRHARGITDIGWYENEQSVGVNSVPLILKSAVQGVKGIAVIKFIRLTFLDTEDWVNCRELAIKADALAAAAFNEETRASYCNESGNGDVLADELRKSLTAPFRCR